MFRKIATAALAAALVTTVVVAAPAQAAPAKKKPPPISLATSTPAIDAAGGQAAFTVSGLPKGPAYLLLLDPSSQKWVRKATVAKSGAAGAVAVTGVPQGVTQFRVQSGKRFSNPVSVKAYGLYTFGDYTKQHTYGAATMASTQGYLPSYKDLKVPAGFGCEVVDFGLQMESPQPTWHATIVVTSAAGVSQIEIMSIPSEVTTASATGKAASGLIDFAITSSTSNNQPFFGWTGVQFHCLADPGISTMK